MVIAFFIVLSISIFIHYVKNRNILKLSDFISLFISLITFFQGLHFTWLLLSSINFINIYVNKPDSLSVNKMQESVVEGSLNFNQCIAQNLNLSEFEILLFSLAPIALTWLAIEQILKIISPTSKI